MIYETQVERYLCVDGKNRFVHYTYEHELRGVCVWMVKKFVDYTDYTVCLFLVEIYLHSLKGQVKAHVYGVKQTNMSKALLDTASVHHKALFRRRIIF